MDFPECKPNGRASRTPGITLKYSHNTGPGRFGHSANSRLRDNGTRPGRSWHPPPRWDQRDRSEVRPRCGAIGSLYPVRKPEGWITNKGPTPYPRRGDGPHHNCNPPSGTWCQCHSVPHYRHRSMKDTSEDSVPDIGLRSQWLKTIWFNRPGVGWQLTVGHRLCSPPQQSLRHHRKHLDRDDSQVPATHGMAIRGGSRRRETHVKGPKVYASAVNCAASNPTHWGSAERQEACNRLM